MLSMEKKTPIDIMEKEGLALLNGTQFISAYTCFALTRFRNCLENADIIGAMSVESTLSSVVPFSKEISELRPFQGAQHVASKVRNLLKFRINLFSKFWIFCGINYNVSSFTSNQN